MKKKEDLRKERALKRLNNTNEKNKGGGGGKIKKRSKYTKFGKRKGSRKEPTVRLTDAQKRAKVSTLLRSFT